MIVNVLQLDGNIVTNPLEDSIHLQIASKLAFHCEAP
jgi:hypothetical protein